MYNHQEQNQIELLATIANQIDISSRQLQDNNAQIKNTPAPKKIDNDFMIMALLSYKAMLYENLLCLSEIYEEVERILTLYGKQQVNFAITEHLKELKNQRLDKEINEQVI